MKMTTVPGSVLDEEDVQGLDDGVQNVLIVGNDGSGKTELVKHLPDGLDGLPVAGFWTEPVPGAGGRVRTFTFRDDVLEYRTSDSRVATNLIPMVTEPAEAVLIDEINGVMLRSRVFRAALGKLLDGARPVVMTAQSGMSKFIEAHAERPDVQVLELTLFNRATLAKQIERWLREMTTGALDR